ncbi:MAG: enoyl-CoA hydratase [Blastocatellia bacterium AA13]|nr:MAG: enoyl-CoA hydratase [Blastocatellia bacterium AA13]
MMEHTFENILVQSDAPIAIVTLNRPERRNALSTEMMRDLIRCLGSIGESKEIKAVIINGAGSAFSAGHDLSEMRGRDVSEYRRIFDLCTRMMTLIQEISQPVIAEVAGMATAAGCQLVASCDLAIASEEARFATPGVRIGLFCSTPMVALSRAIGRKRALEMLVTGTPIDSAVAADWGLVNRVVPAARLREETMSLARKIAEASTLTMSVGKQAFYAQIDMDQPKAYAYAKEVMSLNAMAADAQEGMCAFLEKRSPNWKGR